MDILLTCIHVLAAFVMVAVVLLQQGKGADVGAAFGGGSSQTVFGSRGAGNFLTKMTTGAVVVFMLTSVSLAVRSTPRSVFDDLEPLPDATEAPAGSFPEATPIDGDSESEAGDEALSFEGMEAVPSPEAASPSEAGPSSGEPAPADATQSPQPTQKAPAGDESGAAPDPGDSESGDQATQGTEAP